MKTVALFLVVALVILGGCNVVSKRLFQKEVPGPVLKGLKETEFERRAARLIAEQIKEPKELIPVAQALSQSLGAPEKPIPVEKPEDLPKAAEIATKELMSAIVAMQVKLDELNEKLTKYEGKKIEGTGFVIAGPSAVAIVVVLVALCILFPPVLTVLLFLYRRLKASAAIVVKQIDKTSEEIYNQEPKTEEEKKEQEAALAAFDKLKNKLSNTMDRKHKAVILDLKKAKTP